MRTGYNRGMDRPKLTVVTPPGVTMAEAAEHMRAAHRASGVSLAEAGRSMGLALEKQMKMLQTQAGASSAEAKRRFERDWQSYLDGSVPVRAINSSPMLEHYRKGYRARRHPVGP
jgi:hypothetical protein